MIDTKELRQLAQDATPGPWFSDARGNIWRRPLSDLYENGGSVAGDKPIAFAFVGWSGEGVTGYPVENNARLIAAANPAAISGLLDRLEAAEKVRDWNAERLEEAIEELKALRAKIEAAEKQKPVMWANSSNIISTRIWPALGSAGHHHKCSETKTANHDTPLYLAPGAKGEDK